MLGDIDRSLEPIEYELILCKPDKTQIGVINYEDITYDARFPTTDELSFNINYGENYYDLIKGDYLVLLNDEKYFIIDSPEEIGDGIEIKNIHCYSLEYMLNKKIIRSYNFVSRKLYTLSNDLDEEGYQLGVMNYIKTLTSWKLDAQSFLDFVNSHTIYRSFDISEKTLFDFLINDVQPAFGCIFLFDTKTKTISVKTLDQLQGNKGLYISEENYIKSINKQIKNDEIRTRLYCFGNDISISDINPTGAPYIENYTFYKDTDYMSQDLINSLNAYEEYLSSLEILTTWKSAILNYASLPSSGLTIGDTYQITSDVNPDNNGYWRWDGTIWEQININYSILLSQLNIIQIEYTALDNDLIDAEGVLEIAQDAVDMAISTNQSLTQLNIDLDNAEILVSSKQQLVDSKQSEINNKNNEIINYRNSIDISNYINTEALVEEFDNFIKETTWHDSNYTDSSELLEEGKKKLLKLCTPPLIFDIEIIDFLQIVECQHDWSKLVLGDIVNVEFSKFEIDIWVRLIGYTYKPKDNSLVLSFSNKDSIDDPNIYFKDLISNAITSSTTLSMNKVDWDNKVNPSVITELRNENIDATLKKILASKNQSQIIDKRGIWLKEIDDNGIVSPEQLRIINNIIALTKDGWQTASTGITPDGVNASVLWGKTVIANSGLFDGIDVYDGTENPVVEIGKYMDGETEKRGIRIKGGSLEIVEGLPESQINQTSTSNWNSAEQNAIDSAKIYADNTFSTIATRNTDYDYLLGLIDGSVSTWFYDYTPIYATVTTTTLTSDTIIHLDNVLGLSDGMSISFYGKTETTDILIVTKIIATDGVDSVNKTITLTEAIGVELTANQVIIYNVPSSDWNTTAQRDNHLGDVFYNNLTGYGYRFIYNVNLYSWSLITDSAITEALQKANEAYDIATDHKRRVFYQQDPDYPTPPYDEGDLWDTGGVLKKCTTSKISGETYLLTDWTNTSVGQSLEDISSDSKLSASEKQSVKLQWDAIVAEKSILDNQANTYGILMEDVYTIYDEKYNDLDAYLNTSIISPNTTALLFSLTATSDINGETFRTNFSNYYTAKKNLLNVMNTTIPTVGTVGIPVANADGTITISWSGFTDNGSGIAGYYIWRATSATGTDKFIVGTATQDILSFIDKTVQHQVSYWYYVSAYNKVGNESELPELEWKSCTANNTNIPSAPISISAIARLGRIDITWDKSSSNDVVGYILEKSTDSGSTYPTIFNINTNNYTEYNISASTTTLANYRYRVKAVDIIGLSSLYTISSAPNTNIYKPADAFVPNTPTNLTLTPDYDGRITISWTASTSTDVEKYRIYRSLNNINYYVIAETTSRQYTDPYLKPAQIYYYKVSAIDYSGMESSLTSAQNSIAVDNTAPTPPNPTTTSQFGAIKVTWTEISEQGLIYEIWRCSGSTWSDGSATKIASVAGSGASQGYFIDYDPPVDIPTTYTYKLKVRDKWNNVSTSFSLNSSSATSSILNDTVGLLSTNPNFSNWLASSNYPVGFSAWSSYSGPTRETTLKINGSYACRWNIGTAQAGMAMDSSAYVSNIANHKYLVIEIDFMLVSGALTGAGILINWIGMSTPYHATIKLSDYVLSPTLGKWYTVRTLVTRPHDNLSGWTGMTGYVMANSYSIDTTATKDIIFDRVSIRIATNEEISTNEFVNVIYPTDKTTLEGLIDGKADTFYQTIMPHPEYVNVPDNSDYNKFVTDLWYDSTPTIKKTYIYTKTVNGSNFDYKWSQQEIPKDIFDTIDGKKTIYTLKPTSYQKDDLWILESDIVHSLYSQGEILTSNSNNTSYLESNWVLKVRYTDDTVANQAWNKFSGLNNTLPSGNVEFNFATSDSQGGNAINTDNVGTQTAETVQTATINFDGRNDRKSTTPANPIIANDGTSIDHTINTDGSANISFEWDFTGTGDAYDIDGFIVYVYQSDVNFSYTFGTTVASEQVFYVTPEKRAFILHGIPSNKYYTFGIKAYRIVDQDINASGVLVSSIIKSAYEGENPYQPSSTVAFGGDVTGTIDGVSASTVKDQAGNSLQPDTSYNSTYITQNGIQVKNGTSTEVVNMGEFATGLYGIRASHSDSAGGGHTQLTANGLERLVDGETIPYQYETHIISGSTIGLGVAWVDLDWTDAEEAAAKLVWENGLYIDLPVRFRNKAFKCFLSTTAMQLPLGVDAAYSYTTLTIVSTDVSLAKVQVRGYCTAYESFEGYYYQGIEFLLITVL